MTPQGDKATEMYIIKNGEVAKKFVGIASKDDIAAAIDAAM